MTDRHAARGGLLALLALFLLSAPARAYHTEQEHLTDDTAWTIAGDKTWRLGLFKFAVGLGNRITLGTYTLPWFGATPNAYLKWRFYAGDTWNWAAQVGFFRLDTAAFDKKTPDPPVFGVFSASFLQSLRLSADNHLSNGLVATAVRARGTVDQDTLSGAGEAGLTNIQYVGAYELRLSKSTALVVTGRYLIAQVLAANTRFTAHPDDYTTIDVVADAQDDSVVNFRGAFSIVPSFAFSWQTFNLELGLGYGHFNVPGVNFMINRRTLIPTFDMYWTF
ncbi:MAG: hypothetical protein ABI895_18905 [Deltaproteobacteria bacterium]